MTLQRPALLVALNVGDLATTLEGLRRGDHEVAPAAALVLARTGLAGLLAASFLGLVIQLAVLAVLPRRFQAAGWFLCLALAAVPVIHNVAVLAGLLP